MPPPPPEQSALVVAMCSLDKLTLDPLNARDHKPAQIRQIARSIEAFGYNVPILVDRDGKVISGHGRFMALRLLGRTEAPVIRLEHLSPQQARAFAIADNRLTETSEWNEKLLAEHLKGLSELDLTFRLEDTGFTTAELDMKIEGLQNIGGGQDDPDDTPVDPGPSVARPDDLWRLGRHRLLCASALTDVSYTRLMGGSLAALVVTDPPYNIPIDGNVSNLMGGKNKRRHREFQVGVGEFTEPEFTVFLTTLFRHMAAASAEGSLHYIFMSWANAFPLMAAGRASYDDLINICVWAKPQGAMGGLYRSAHEFVFVFKHGRHPHQNNVRLGKYGRNRTNVWSYPGANAFLRSSEDADLIRQHPTPKSVQLIADAILDASARRDIVLDPFVGSGTTLVAAERVGRTCYAMELDPLYVDLTIRRWQRLTGETARLEGGKTFDELAKAGRNP